MIEIKIPKINTLFITILLTVLIVVGLGRSRVVGNSSSGDPSPSLEDIIDYFLEIALGSEYGSDDKLIKKWSRDLRIQVFGSTTSQDMDTLHQVITELNELIGNSVQLSIVDSIPNVKMYFVSKSEFLQYEPDHGSTNSGFGRVWSVKYEIYKARLLIATDAVTQTERSHAIREELTQSIGLMNDSWKYPDTIFYDGWTETTKYAEIDKKIIEILYRENIIPGMTEEQIRSILSLPDTHFLLPDSNPESLFEEDSGCFISILSYSDNDSPWLVWIYKIRYLLINLFT